MNILSDPGKAIYGALTFVAFLCALGISYVFAWGSAIDGPAAGEAGFVLSRLVLSAIFTGTAAHFVGLLGTTSRVRAFPLLSIIGSLFLLVPLLRYSANVAVAYSENRGLGNEEAGALLMTSLQAVVLIFSLMKLRQLRIAR